MLGHRITSNAGLVAGIVLTLIGLVLAATAGTNPDAAPAAAWWQLPGVVKLGGFAAYFGGATLSWETLKRVSR